MWWIFVTPVTNGSVKVNGTNLLLTVPAGPEHDLWSGGDNTVRVVQSVANGDFLIQAKFDSSLTVSSGAPSQMQGILVEQDSSNFLRFDELAGWGAVRMFSGKILGGVASSTIDVGITPSYPIWLRVQRTGNTFTFSWSTNGTSFTTAGSFTQALTVNRVGLYGGNAGSPAPAFTASVDYFLSGSGPDLTITKSHTGNFTLGGTGSYPITATNSGNAPTSGTVTVADTLPTGLTPTTATGTGWSCGIATQTVTCTTSTALAAGASYPNITLAVNVASNAPATVTNTATVSGGGETNTSNDTANDVTTINVSTPPDLTISKSHSGNFVQGQAGATYTITVTNSGGSATSGTVSMTDTLPTSLTPTAISGTGWTCTLATLTCTRSDTLVAAASYPAITLTTNVASNAPAS